MDAFRAIADPLERYVYLRTLQRGDTETFYRALISRPLELMPFVYTPTVGQACLEFGESFRRPRGMYFNHHDVGDMPP